MSDKDNELLSASKPAAPEGWKLVPVEPTPEMLAHIAESRVPPSDRYRGALAASPAAPDHIGDIDEKVSAGPAQSVVIPMEFKDWFESAWASYEDKAISGGKIVSMAWALKGYRAAPTGAGEAIYQVQRDAFDDNAWYTVPKDTWDRTGTKWRRVVYAAPQPSQPAECVTACSPFKCEAAQQDGVLCADDSCDIATGVRSAVLLDDERAAFFDVVFDGPPAHESGRFVEVEDENGCSFNAGEWIDRGNGLWALRIARAAPPQATAQTDQPLTDDAILCCASLIASDLLGQATEEEVRDVAAQINELLGRK